MSQPHHACLNPHMMMMMHVCCKRMPQHATGRCMHALYGTVLGLSMLAGRSRGACVHAQPAGLRGHAQAMAGLCSGAEWRHTCYAVLLQRLGKRCLTKYHPMDACMDGCIHAWMGACSQGARNVEHLSKWKAGSSMAGNGLMCTGGQCQLGTPTNSTAAD